MCDKGQRSARRADKGRVGAERRKWGGAAHNKNIFALNTSYICYSCRHEAPRSPRVGQRADNCRVSAQSADKAQGSTQSTEKGQGLARSADQGIGTARRAEKGRREAPTMVRGFFHLKIRFLCVTRVIGRPEGPTRSGVGSKDRQKSRVGPKGRRRSGSNADFPM